MRVTVLLGMVAVGLWGQAPEPKYEIRGSVIEEMTNLPIPGARVTVSEVIRTRDQFGPVVLATIFTDERGAYLYRPSHAGQFLMEVYREGYRSVDQEKPTDSAILNPDAPTHSGRVMLFRPGTLRGRVVDEEDRPVENMRVTVVTPELDPSAKYARLTTGPDGVFEVENLRPGGWLIEIRPQTNVEMSVTTEFTEEDAAKVDRDYEHLFYPGGVRNREDATPIVVQPSGDADLGDVRIRKVPYYRAVLTYEGDCAGREKWFFDQVMGLGADCSKQFLLKMLRPGKPPVEIQAGAGRPGRWPYFAIVELGIRDANVARKVQLTPLLEIAIRVRVPEGSEGKLSKGLTVTVGHDTARVKSVEELITLKLDSQEKLLRISSVPAGMAVREIRYGGVPLEGMTIRPAAGTVLEIVLDDQPASIEVTLRDRERTPELFYFVVARWPVPAGLEEAGSAPPYRFYAYGRDGKARVTRLGEGTYRVAVLKYEGTPTAAEVMTGLTEGRSVTVRRGEQKTLEIVAPR